jgi:hypothetical protein
MERFVQMAIKLVVALGLVVGLSGCGSDPAPPGGTTQGSEDTVSTTSGDARGGEVDTMRGSVDVPVVSEVREADVSPPVVNPLIAKLPGEWERVVPDDGYPATVEVFPDHPDCDWGGGAIGPPGDACVDGFSPIVILILDGNQLRAAKSDGTRAEGRVVEGNGELRVEFTMCSLGPACEFSLPYTRAYVRIDE